MMKSYRLFALFLAGFSLLSCKEEDLTGGLSPMNVRLSFDTPGVQSVVIDSESPVFTYTIAKNYAVYATRATLTALTADELAQFGTYTALAEDQYEFEPSVGIPGSAVSQTGTITFHNVLGLEPGVTYAMGLAISSSANEKVGIDETENKIVVTLTVGNEGSMSNPFRVSTAEEMVALNVKLNSYDADVAGALETIGTDRFYISLIDDIDFAGIDYAALTGLTLGDTESNWQSLDNGLLPIHFEGNNHTIRNLVVKSGAAPSFFGNLNGTVQNLRFENAVIVAKNEKAGVVAGSVGLVGWGRDVAGYLYNVHVLSGSVTHNAQTNWVGWTGQAGGLAGELCHASSTIQNCSANVDVTSDFIAGGLVGQANRAAFIDCCYATGNVTCDAIKATDAAGDRGGDAWVSTQFRDIAEVADGYAGGLVGNVVDTEISNCYATGTVTNTNNNGFERGVAGGVVGKSYWDGIIANCYSTSEVNGWVDGGGILGTCGFFDGGNNSIISCIAWNDIVTAKAEPGRVTGFVNYMTNYNRGRSCYAKSSMQLLSNGTPVEIVENAEINTTPNNSARYEGLSTTDIIGTANQLGWDDRHWDLSGELPKLQWEKEANLPTVE